MQRAAARPRCCRRSATTGPSGSRTGASTTSCACTRRAVRSAADDGRVQPRRVPARARAGRRAAHRHHGERVGPRRAGPPRRSPRREPARVRRTGSSAESARVKTRQRGVLRALRAVARRPRRCCSRRPPRAAVPYAGVPWFVAPFGRDSIITALQLLPYHASVAAGTLRFLAARQGRVRDDFKDEEPGKILHEYRRGEMANCREIPFIPYYGTHRRDAALRRAARASTCAGPATFGSRASCGRPRRRRSTWMRERGDRDGDGYLEYATQLRSSASSTRAGRTRRTR